MLNNIDRQISFGDVNLLMNTLNTSREANTCREAYLSEDYISLFIQYDEDLINKLKDIDYVCTYSILPPIYVVSVRADKYDDFIRKFRNTLSIDLAFLTLYQL